ncbi:MAG: DUF4345 family protein [Hahellaceae bacterium]|nr:DUF4345 family protein [Hahellaceae bacterium]MCP5168378.1 DUF4345 family protein [Hahellaceae bacterium]
MAATLRFVLYLLALVALVTGLNVLMGGVGRLISTLTVGTPSAILIPAMVLEFIIPFVVYGMYWKLFKKDIAKSSAELA